jgi:hypothetical protein
LLLADKKSGAGGGIRCKGQCFSTANLKSTVAIWQRFAYPSSGHDTSMALLSLTAATGEHGGTK